MLTQSLVKIVCLVKTCLVMFFLWTQPYITEYRLQIPNIQNKIFPLDTPVCLSQGQNIRVSRGETKRVVCQVDSNPPPVSFKWVKKREKGWVNSPISNHQYHILSRELNSNVLNLFHKSRCYFLVLTGEYVSRIFTKNTNINKSKA